MVHVEVRQQEVHAARRAQARPQPADARARVEHQDRAVVPRTSTQAVLPP
jgi:hypothetical protein